MRLTLINQFYTPDISPTAHLCASLAEHRAALGDNVTVLTSRAGYLSPVSQSPEKSLVKVLRLWSTCFGSRSKLGRLMDWLTFYLPAAWAAATMPRQDVIIALTTPPFIAMAGWLHKLIHPSTRLILWNMDVYPEALERTKLIKPHGLAAGIMRAVNRLMFRRLDHLICLDHAMAELLLSQYSPLSRSVAHSIIPNWEAAELFPPPGLAASQDSSGEADVRESRSAPPARLDDSPLTPALSPEYRGEGAGALADQLAGKFVILYLGNAGFGHEFATMIQAAERLRGEPAVFLFVGGGALRPWIAGQCAARRLSNILLSGYVPKSQTPEVMRRADCALITLENDMLGVMSPSKLHANLAMGLPVIYVGPAGGNVDAAIARFGCGISLRPGQGDELAAFIRSLMSDPARASELKKLAREAFKQAYCDVQTLPQFDRVLSDGVRAGV